VAHLEGVPGWIPVFRGVRSAVYLRANPRNRANLERVSRWYQRQGIPFDPARGVDAGAVAREHPEWAARRGLVWEGFGRLLEAARSGDPGAQELLAVAFGRLGAYADALALDAELAARDPRAKAPRRRSVQALLRTGRLDEALAVAEELVAIDREDPISREHVRLVRRAQALAEAPYRLPVAAATDRLPLPTAIGP
jgi:tetratricopeptide (TPR) repeat protein